MRKVGSGTPCAPATFTQVPRPKAALNVVGSQLSRTTTCLILARLFDVARLIGYSYYCCPGHQPYGNTDSAQVISQNHFDLLLVVMENVPGTHGCAIDARHPARNADTLLFGNPSDPGRVSLSPG